jgi:fructose-bisphosphate aldolase, class II
MTAKELLLKAKSEKYAIGAFNAANLETLKSIVAAASKLSSPVLIEASEGEADYVGKTQLAALIRIYKIENNIPIILNLDHASSFDACKEAIDAGFDYVHFDGSKLPFDENVRTAKEVVKYAHEHNVLVEGEIDHIEGSSADHTKQSPEEFQKGSHYTDPKQALEFVSSTGIDVFASFIGNLHGLYAEEVHLRLDLLEEIKKLLPDTFLSLHGGSGLNDEEVRKAIKIGISKVNVNSEMRIAFKKTLQTTLNESDEVAIYKLTPPAISAVQEVVEKKIMLFGSNNKHNLKHSRFLPII